MKILLNTHVLLWAALDPPKLSRNAEILIADAGNQACVSAATLWEIGNKVRQGKLPIAAIFEQQLPELVLQTGYTVLPIDATVALTAARLLGEHRDPFDRFIAAHALAEGMLLLSKDKEFDNFGVRRLW